MQAKLFNVLKIICIAVALWISGTITYQAFQCPRMTDTERFLYIPQSFILNFKYCNDQD